MQLNKGLFICDKASLVIKLFTVGVILVYMGVFAGLYEKASMNPLEWTISDWLINYEDGGFKRRGLLGSSLFFLQDLLHIKLQYLILLLQITALSAIVYGMFLFLKKYKTDLFYLYIMISPYILLFPALTIRSAGRREILLIILLLWYVHSKKSKFNDFILFILYIIFLFIHELGFFFLPFVVWINYLKYKTFNTKYSFSLLLVSGLAIGAVYKWGGSINQGDSLSILFKRGVVLNQMNIFTKEYSFDFKYVLRYKFSFFIHILELLSVIVQMGFYVYLFKKSFFLKYIYGNILCLLWIAPLFYLGIDWFRWIYIYATLLFLVVSFQLDINMTSKMRFNDNIIRKGYIIFSVLSYIVILVHLQHNTLVSLLSKYN